MRGVDIGGERARITREAVKDDARIRWAVSIIYPEYFLISFFDIVVSTPVFYQIRNLKGMLQEINLIIE